MGKKSKPPPAPDYTALAEKNAASAKEAATATTLANRPNQVNASGDTSTWSQDPATGAWTQKQTLGSTGQAQLDATNSQIGTAQGQVTDALGNPLDFSGATQIGDYNYDTLQGVDANSLRAGAGQFQMDPTGNSKAIQDATYGLLAPQREMALNSEIQRLKNQGLTEDSPAFQRAMLRQGQADTDAQLKSLLAGQQEYGNAFNRGLAASGQNYGQRSDAEKFAMALRGQQFGEQTNQIGLNAGKRDQDIEEMLMKRNQPLNELQALTNIQSGQETPQFGGYGSAQGTQGIDYAGAAQKNYEADVAQTNAKNASKAGLLSTVGSIAGSFFGPVGTAVGGAIGGALGPKQIQATKGYTVPTYEGAEY